MQVAGGFQRILAAGCSPNEAELNAWITVVSLAIDCTAWLGQEVMTVKDRDHAPFCAALTHSTLETRPWTCQSETCSEAYQECCSSL